MLFIQKTLLKSLSQQAVFQAEDFYFQLSNVTLSIDKKHFTIHNDQDPLQKNNAVKSARGRNAQAREISRKNAIAPQVTFDCQFFLDCSFDVQSSRKNKLPL